MVNRSQRRFTDGLRPLQRCILCIDGYICRAAPTLPHDTARSRQISQVIYAAGKRWIVSFFPLLLRRLLFVINWFFFFLSNLEVCCQGALPNLLENFWGWLPNLSQMHWQNGVLIKCKHGQILLGYQDETLKQHASFHVTGLTQHFTECKQVTLFYSRSFLTPTSILRMFAVLSSSRCHKQLYISHLWRFELIFPFFLFFSFLAIALLLTVCVNRPWSMLKYIFPTWVYYYGIAQFFLSLLI